jgi:hypothetical protein
LTGTREIDLKECLSDSYYALRQRHSGVHTNFDFPTGVYYYHNFAMNIRHQLGETFHNTPGTLRRLFHSANFMSYYNQVNPISRFFHSVKVHLFLPGANTLMYKNLQYYCDTLAKTLRKDYKKVDAAISDFEIVPCTYGIYINIFSKVPKLSLDTLKDMTNAMACLNKNGGTKTITEDSIRVDLASMNVIDLAHHQLMCALNLFSDQWEANLQVNFLKLQEISKQVLFSKTVMIFTGSFNAKECRVSSEHFSNNFCYQRRDFFLPTLARYCVIPPRTNLILEHKYLGKGDNSCLLAVYQTRVNDFREFYGFKDWPGKLTEYEVAKVCTLLAHHFLQAVFFQALRSEMSLGYNVYSRVLLKEGMLGVGYYIQSSENCPNYLGLLTATFVKQEASKLFFTQEQLNAALKVVLKKPRDRVYQYPDIVIRLTELFYMNESFDEYIRIPNQYDTDLSISVEDFTRFWSKFYLEGSSTLEVHVVGEEHAEAQASKEFLREGERHHLACYLRETLPLSKPFLALFKSWAELTN